MRLDIVLDPCPMRFVIVHYHIFKNGGSTIESILEREFPGQFATLHGPTPDTKLDGGHLVDFLEKNPTIAALSSHHLRYPKPAIRDTVLFDCCFLRHPLDRLRSVYTHLQSDSTDPLGALAQRQSQAEFMQGLLDKSPHLISDIHVHQLANSGAFTRPANEQDLDRATRILLDMAIPGVVDMFDESLIAAEYFLKPAFPALHLEYVRQNVSCVTDLAIAERQSQLKQLWGTTVYNEVARLNQFDLELYRRAQEEIARRLELVPQASKKLVEFRSRCSALDKSHSHGSLRASAQRGHGGDAD